MCRQLRASVKQTKSGQSVGSNGQEYSSRCLSIGFDARYILFIMSSMFS